MIGLVMWSLIVPVNNATNALGLESLVSAPLVADTSTPYSVSRTRFPMMVVLESMPGTVLVRVTEDCLLLRVSLD